MTYIGTTPNYGTLHSQTITTANGSTATFTLDQYVADADSIIVTIGNVVQEPVTAYTASGNSITFTENVPNGDTIVIRYLGRQIDVPTSYTQSTRYKYVATNNQTTFQNNDANGLSLSYTVGNIDLFLNGVHLDETDFTASNGTSVVLGSGATTNDELVIVAWKTVQISNALDKTAGGTVTGATTFSGAFTSQGIDDNADATTITLDANEDITAANGMYVSGDLTSLTVDKGGIDRSGNTTRIISGRSGGNYADMSFNIAGVGGVNRQVYIDYQGNMTLDNGNLVIGTSGKGIDFSANSNVSGMTSELLDDYEEGSATVNMVSSGATFAFGGSDGSETTLYYIKIGRLVHYFMNWDSSSTVSGTTSNAVSITNLPFSSSYGDTFSVWFHRGGAGAVDIMPTAYSTSMSFMTSPTSGGMWSDMTAASLNHTDQRLRISGTTIVN